MPARTRGRRLAAGLWGRADIGAKSGLAVGVVFALLATLDRVSRGAVAFDSRGISYRGLIATYLVGYTIAGSVAWAMLPLGRSAVGAMFVGAVSTLPLMCGVRLAAWGLAPRSGLDDLLFGLGAVTGAYLGWAAHREWKNGRLGSLSKDARKK